MSVVVTEKCTAEPESEAGVEPAALRRMLHDTAQPLTVLTMLLGEAGSSPEVALTGELLRVAQTECARVVAAVQQLQSVAGKSTVVVCPGTEVLS